MTAAKAFTHSLQLEHNSLPGIVLQSALTKRIILHYLTCINELSFKTYFHVKIL